MLPGNTSFAAHVDETWVIALHFGSFGGELVQVVYVLGGLAPVVLLITGRHIGCCVAVGRAPGLWRCRKSKVPNYGRRWIHPMTNRSCLRILATTVVVLGAIPAPHAFAQSLPSGWATTDIRTTGGSATGSGGSFTMTGAGADIWGNADAFRYVYKTLTGDGSIVAQVTGVEHAHAWTKAGVMMRATLSAGSPHAMMIVSADKGLAFQRRVAANGLSSHTSGGTGQAPQFVKLVRTGTTFTASRSADGTTWTVIGSSTIAMPATIYVGLAVTSHVSGVAATATFASTAVTGDTAPPVATQTIVFFRHAEKPSGGYGQITCQGLRRALALPEVLIGRFGQPEYIFAPNPLPKIADPAGSFHYVRPLATIEPTAIRLGLPVNAQYGRADIAGLQGELLSPAYATATIFVSWEHVKLVEAVQSIMNFYGSGVTVPQWTYGDYDSLYIVRLASSNGTVTAQFERDFQGLNNLPTSCP
jgi:hypothetical protein